MNTLLKGIGLLAILYLLFNSLLYVSGGILVYACYDIKVLPWSYCGEITGLINVTLTALIIASVPPIFIIGKLLFNFFKANKIIVSRR